MKIQIKRKVELLCNSTLQIFVVSKRRRERGEYIDKKDKMVDTMTYIKEII